MLRETGNEPRIIEYLKTPPTRAELKDLLTKLGMTPRQLLRRRGTPFDELGLDDPAKTDEQLIDAILAHPILMERPVVVTGKGVRRLPARPRRSWNCWDKRADIRDTRHNAPPPSRDTA